MRKRSIGKLSKETGLSVQTIRYYEQLGILPEPARTDSGYRNYSDDYFEHINFIKNAREFGFSLEEIKVLVNLKSSEAALGKDVKEIVNSKIQEIDEQIKSLETTRNYLTSLNQSCSGKMSTDKCPILKKLKSCNKD